MSLKIIGGVNGRPILNYAGTEWVAMESPNPHAPGTNTVRTSTNAGVVSSASEITVTALATPGEFFWNGDIFMVHPRGNGTLNFTFSWGTGVRRATPQTGYAQGTAQRVIAGNTVGGSGGILSFTNFPPEATTGSLAVPYYRYRLRVNLGGSAYYASSDAWVKLTITLS
jgi:hypothetical protein